MNKHNTIWYLPLEKIETRYTTQWYKWFKDVFEENGLKYKYIEGEKIKSSLDKTLFLDMKKTFVWKFEQLKQLFKQDLKDGDWIFIPDGEMPGLEALEYFRKFYNKKIKIAQIWHAGTYDSWDLTAQKGLTRVGKNLEETWMDIADVIFVATQYHKDLIVKNRLVNPNKIKITGLPVDIKGLKKYDFEPKEGIIFTGRLSKEKGIDLARSLGAYICLEHDLTKEEYYKKLGESKFVFAPSEQETFGYGIIEGMAVDAMPIVPNKLAFKETVPKRFRYDNIAEIPLLISKNINSKTYFNLEKYQYQKVINKMLSYMK